MDLKKSNSGQAALEFMMTYGWALVVIAGVVASLMFLLGNQSSIGYCMMTPESGAITYQVSNVSNGTFSAILRNDSGKEISNLSYTFTGDFAGASSSNTGPYVPAEDFKIDATGTGIVAGEEYVGVVTITYTRKGIIHASVLECSGTA